MKRIYHLMALAVLAGTLLTGCGSKLTKENYDKVTIGMTKDQVTEVLGAAKDKSETDAPGLGKMDVWSYDNIGYGGKLIVITFLNGKVSDRMWHE
jgi:hypothetical protein